MLPGDDCLTDERRAMNRKFVALIFATAASITTGCSYSKTAPATHALMTAAFAAGAALPQRYIAERHKLEIIAPESELQKTWESTVAYCGAIQCEVISSSITTRTGDAVPSGTLFLR